MNNQKLCIDCDYCENVKLVDESESSLLSKMTTSNVCTHPRFITPQYVASGDKARLPSCSYLRKSIFRCAMKGRHFVSQETRQDIEAIKKCYECNHMKLDPKGQICTKNNSSITIQYALKLLCENNKYFEAKK